MKQIIFNTANKSVWLEKIFQIHSEYACKESEDIIIAFDKHIKVDDIEPLHLVTLACTIQYLFDKGHKVFLNRTSNIAIHNYIYNDLDFSAYWRGGKNHVETKNSGNIFNLWRIVDSEKDLYAKHVEEYFKRNYFNEKDLSAISMSLVEAFYNVFDHAYANGNAFSLIKYDEAKHILSVAVADFGVGIANSVRNYDKSFSTDEDAIEWATRDNSTVRSTKRNKGLGLGTILAASSTGRIFSGNGLLLKLKDNIRKIPINFRFPGTLIYLDIDLSTFENEEILETFNW